MPVTAPGATLLVTKAGGFIAPAMSAEPLQTALINTNWLYLYQRPANNSTVVLATSAARTLICWFPVIPSADGLIYRFRTGIYAGAVGNVTLTTEWADAAMAAWNVLEAATAVATINGHVVHTFDAVLPATAAVVRITFAYDGFTAFRPGQILIWPQPVTIAAGIAASGFRPVDDTMLAAAGGPVNTEMLDRCMFNRGVILRDRWQAVGGFAQGSTAATARYGVTAITYTPICQGRPKIPLPPTQVYSLQYAVIASVSGGGTAALVLLQTPLGVVQIAADGALQTGTISCQGQTPLIIVSLLATAGWTTYLHSFTLFWRPGD